MKNLNNNHLLEELESEFNKIEAPDLKEQIKAKYYIQKESKFIKEKTNFKKPAFNFRYLMNSLVATLAVIIIVITLTIIREPASNNPINRLVEGDKNIITFEAYTAISLMYDTSSAENQSLEYNDNYYLPLSTTESTVQVDKIHKFLPLVEQVLTVNSGINITVIEESDKPEYTNQEIIEIATALDQVNTYTFYYNIIDSNATDNEFSFQGIMIYKDNQYQLEGIKEVEDEKAKLSLRATYNTNNWVRVEQKFDENIEKFKYTLSEDGVVTNSNIRIKNKNDKVEVEIEFQDQQTKGQYNFKKVMDTVNNRMSIKAINVLNSRDNFDIYIVEDESTGHLMYEYMNERKETIRKDNGHGKFTGPEAKNPDPNDDDNNGPEPNIPNPNHPGNNDDDDLPGFGPGGR